LQVAGRNQVGGTNLTAGEVTLSQGGTYTNPTVTVIVQKNNLPTFFGRIWGTQFVIVRASATAEAYNPSGAGPRQAPVAPTCVKPWLLPNIDPSSTLTPTPTIFDARNGSITNTGLLGWTYKAPSPNSQPMSLACDPPNTGTSGDCTGPPP